MKIHVNFGGFLFALVAQTIWLCTWLCHFPVTLGQSLSLWESQFPYLYVGMRVPTSWVVLRKPTRDASSGAWPTRAGGCSISCPVSGAPVHRARGQPCTAHSLRHFLGDGGGTVRPPEREKAGAIMPRVCRRRCLQGLRDSWAARAEPAPPLRSAQPWRGAHRPQAFICQGLRLATQGN